MNLILIQYIRYQANVHNPDKAICWELGTPSVIDKLTVVNAVGELQSLNPLIYNLKVYVFNLSTFSIDKCPD